MKKLFISIPIFALLFLVPSAQAQDNETDRETKIVTLPVGEVVNRDYFAFGDVVEVSGTVNGDVYAFGGQVLVDGAVNGDLITAGGTLTVSGDVSQDLRAGGGQVTISGDIGRNVTVGGGNVEFTSDASVRGSVLAGAGNLTLAAPIGSNVKIGAGNLTISSKVDGDVEAGVGMLRLTSRARVDGDLTYWSDQNASVDGNALVSGEITKKSAQGISKPSLQGVLGGFAAFNIFTTIIGFVSTFILGLLLIKFLPKFSSDTVNTLSKKPLASLGVGFLALLVTPIAFLILLVTVVGIPIAFILIALYLISLYLARLFVMFWVGKAISTRTGRAPHEVWAFIVGLIIYYIVTLIPVVGGITTFLVILFGLGAALITKRNTYLTARKSNLY
ncbi:MAG: polymer-forming cytoskeletal protein [Candidatus Woykebacteria bacterium]